MLSLQCKHGLEATPPIIHGRLNEGSILGQDGSVSILGFGTEGAPQTDLRPLATLAQRFTNRWPAEMDSFLDALQAPEGFRDIADALDAFPLDDEERDAAALGRAVKRRLKALKAEADGPDTATKDKAKETAPEPRATETRTHSGPSPDVVDVTGDSFNQAKWIALACGMLVVAAFVLEIWSIPL